MDKHYHVPICTMKTIERKWGNEDTVSIETYEVPINVSTSSKEQKQKTLREAYNMLINAIKKSQLDKSVSVIMSAHDMKLQGKRTLHAKTNKKASVKRIYK